jgi:hypothetical protein
MCFSNVYVISLSTNYGFTNYDNLNIGDKINGYSLNWALGYLINELNRDDFLPYENPPRKLPLSLFLTFTILICLVLVLVLSSLLYKKCYSKRDERTPFNRMPNANEDV